VVDGDVASGSAGVVVTVGRPGIGAERQGDDAEDGRDPDRGDHSDEGCHSGTSDFFRNPF